MLGTLSDRGHLLLALLAPWLVGCHRSSTSAPATPAPFTGVMFADDFTGETLAEHWAPSDPRAVEVRDGALAIRGSGHRNTVTLGFWSFAAEDLRIVVRAAPPWDARCHSGLPILRPVFAVVDAMSGEYVAGVMLLPCASRTTTLLRYWVNDPAFDFVEERLPSSAVTGDFFEFTFRLDAEGNASWSRDGLDRFSSRLAEYERLGILLSSGYGSFQSPMRFDSVVVYKE